MSRTFRFKRAEMCNGFYGRNPIQDMDDWRPGIRLVKRESRRKMRQRTRLALHNYTEDAVFPTEKECSDLWWWD